MSTLVHNSTTLHIHDSKSRFSCWFADLLNPKKWTNDLSRGMLHSNMFIYAWIIPISFYPSSEIVFPQQLFILNAAVRDRQCFACCWYRWCLCCHHGCCETKTCWFLSGLHDPSEGNGLMQEVWAARPCHSSQLMVSWSLQPKRPIQYQGVTDYGLDDKDGRDSHEMGMWIQMPLTEIKRNQADSQGSSVDI